MEHLFLPYQIRGCTLKNRIVMPPLASFLLEEGGVVTRKTVEHYRKRAAGGPAMVFMEACAVSPEGVVSHTQARIDDDRLVEGLSKIAVTIKSEGAVPALQIHHAGRQTSAKTIGCKPLGPSPLQCPSIRGEVEPLSISGIDRLVRLFVEAAERARDAGFELIEIHGAHGYLVNQFLSRFSNIRTDEYGGDLQGRTRFAKEIVEKMRKRLGNSFPISFKISAREYVPDGLEDEESIEILKILVEAGVDVVQVSAGNDATPEWISQPMFMKQACLADSAEKIRRSIRVPVMTVGRINHPSIADELIRSGKTDLVCIGRGLLADPELPNKAREGNLDDIRVCIACNTCMQSIFKKGRVECLVNPTLGREEEMALRPAEPRRKVMVIGGGLGGMNFAWVAAQRGHEVDLFEKQSFLGGQLLVSGIVGAYKAGMKGLIDYHIRQIAKFGVHCHLSTEVTVDAVTSRNPDIVVLAIGSSPVFPNVQGIGTNTVCSFMQVLNGTPQSIRNAAVIGGGPTGCEVAHFLADRGSSVTIVEMMPKIGSALESVTRRVLLAQLKEKGVRMMAGYRLSKVEENGVTVTGAEGDEVFLEAEKVIVAIGTRPDNTLYEQIKALGYEIHRIGDCLEPRDAKAAILDGAMLARSI